MRGWRRSDRSNRAATWPLRSRVRYARRHPTGRHALLAKLSIHRQGADFASQRLVKPRDTIFDRQRATWRNERHAVGAQASTVEARSENAEDQPRERSDCSRGPSRWPRIWGSRSPGLRSWNSSTADRVCDRSMWTRYTHDITRQTAHATIEQEIIRITCPAQAGCNMHRSRRVPAVDCNLRPGRASSYHKHSGTRERAANSRAG